MPSLAEFEEWFEAQLPTNIQELPQKIHETLIECLDALHHQLTIYGPPAIPGLPSLAQIEEHLPPNPFKGPATVPPPPPVVAPPSTARGAWQRVSAWTGEHRRAIAIVAGSSVVGIATTLAWRRGWIWLPVLGRSPAGRRSATRPVKSRNGMRREAVVILGADTALGRALARHLSSKGLIVLGSVATPQAAHDFEAQVFPSSQGYVKAIVLDPLDPSNSIPYFLRALNSALSLRWPLTSAGDPYARSNEVIELIGIVNALSYLAAPGGADLKGSGSPNSSTSVSALSAAKLTDALDRHVTTPLCASKALLDALAGPSSARNPNAEPLTLITLLGAADADDVASARRHGLGDAEDQRRIIYQAARAGADSMQHTLEVLNSTAAASAKSSRARKVRVATIEVAGVRPWGFVNLREIMRLGVDAAPPATSDAATAAQGRPADARREPRRTTITTSGKVQSAGSTSASSSSLSTARGDPFVNAILNQTTLLLLAPSTARAFKPIYHLRIPRADALVLEQTTLLRVLGLVWRPVAATSSLIGRAIGRSRLLAGRSLSSPWWRETLDGFGAQLHARRTGISGRDPHAPRPGSTAANSHAHSRAWVEAQQAERRKKAAGEASNAAGTGAATAARPSSLYSSDEGEIRSPPSEGSAASSNGHGARPGARGAAHGSTSAVRGTSQQPTASQQASPALSAAEGSNPSTRASGRGQTTSQAQSTPSATPAGTTDLSSSGILSSVPSSAFGEDREGDFDTASFDEEAHEDASGARTAGVEDVQGFEFGESVTSGGEMAGDSTLRGAPAGTGIEDDEVGSEAWHAQAGSDATMLGSATASASGSANLESGSELASQSAHSEASLGQSWVQLGQSAHSSESNNSTGSS